jgi:hypothetical protein
MPYEKLCGWGMVILLVMETFHLLEMNIILSFLPRDLVDHLLDEEEVRVVAEEVTVNQSICLNRQSENAVVDDSCAVPERLRANPLRSRFGLFYTSISNPAWARIQLCKHLKTVFRGSLVLLKEVGCFSVQLNAGQFGTMVDKMFLEDSCFVPAHKKRPLISPETLRCRVDMPEWLFALLQKGIADIANSRRLFQKSFEIQDCDVIGEFFGAVHHARLLFPTFTSSNSVLVVLSFKMSTGSKALVGKMLDGSVVISSDQSKSKDLRVQVFPYYEINDVGVLVMDKHAEANNRCRKMLKELAKKWMDEEIDLFYPDLGAFPIDQKFLQESKVEFLTDDEMLDTMPKEDLFNQAGEIDDYPEEFSDFYEVMMALRNSQNSVQRRELQFLIEEEIIASRLILKVPHGLFNQDKDRKQVEVLISDIRQKPKSCTMQYENRYHLYYLLSPWNSDDTQVEAAMLFSMLPPLIQALKLLRKTQEEKKHNRLKVMIEAILPQVNEPIIIPPEIFNCKSEDISLSEELLETMKYTTGKARNKAAQNLYRLFTPKVKKPALKTRSNKKQKSKIQEAG